MRATQEPFEGIEPVVDGTFCAYCKGNLEVGAVKCRACGEWLDGRESRASSATKTKEAIEKDRFRNQMFGQEH